MRRFHSYGPVDVEEHFCVPRQALVERCFNQLIGNPKKGGHYFTIWAPRQAGKTWLMRQMQQKITQQHGDQFTFFNFSFGNLRGLGDAPTLENEQVKFPKALGGILRADLPGRPDVNNWEEFVQLFSRIDGLWDRPLILMIDEADTAPPQLLDWIVGRFREMYLYRETHWLHSLALIGVRAVMGVESKRGSPFNIQRSLHVPNFTLEEVRDLYQQYQDESRQVIEPDIVDAVYQSTNGQPGLVGWFGELLTEKYNPGPDQPIGEETWELVWLKARFVEPNNTVVNLVAKAREPEHLEFLVKLFTRSDLPFAFHDSTMSYLYMHGLIEPEMVRLPTGELSEICRFSSPFVQNTLYHALGSDLVGNRMHILALHPLDDLADVFATPTRLDLPALLRRYKEYLIRLKAKGINPWEKQPRRQTDHHLSEAVGHFHLYAWLKEALTGLCIVSPEFPTGNGQVDLHLRAGNKQGLIEVKSFKGAAALAKDRPQAAHYASQLGITEVTMAVFVPVEDEEVLQELSVTERINSVTVNVVAIGWV